jgi:hypothetical protein
MMMMTMPATIESSADQARIRHQRGGHHRALRSLGGFVIADMLDGRAGQIDQIGRHQRQHAGRQEADETGDQGRRDGNVVHCIPSRMAAENYGRA